MRQYYQLTHDYLVPSLRDWLTRKQKETRRGRAELLLADRAAVWNARPENRQLPSLSQWFRIRWLTQKKHWTPPQRKMMAKAGRYHAVRGLARRRAAGGGDAHRPGDSRTGRRAAEGNPCRRVGAGVLDADTAQVPDIIGEMAEYRSGPTRCCGKSTTRRRTNPRRQLHASLALLPVDPGQVDYLYGRLLDAEPHEVPVIRDALAPHKDELLDKLWAVVENAGKGQGTATAAGGGGVGEVRPGERAVGQRVERLVVNDLVPENPVFLGHWSESVPSGEGKAASAVVRTSSEIPSRIATAERSLATNMLADYAADQPQVLADLLMDADEKQFAVIYPKFKDRASKACPC